MNILSITNVGRTGQCCLSTEDKVCTITLTYIWARMNNEVNEHSTMNIDISQYCRIKYLEMGRFKLLCTYLNE